MTEVLAKGVDISEFQHENLIDWGYARAELGILFAYARACYGVRPDKLTARHISRIRSAGVTPGLYHFFRPDLDVGKQLEVLGSICGATNIGAGDLLVAVDVEAWPDKWENGRATHWAQPNPSWCGPLREFVERIAEQFGGPVIYETQADWMKLGRPDWLLAYPQWVAHWPAKGSKAVLERPATPGNVQWAFWQQLVDPLDKVVFQDPTAKGAVDQDVARLPLPVIGDPVPELAPIEPDLIPLTLDPETTSAMLAERNRAIAELEF